jgi:hypothetical protein
VSVDRVLFSETQLVKLDADQLLIFPININMYSRRPSLVSRLLSR